jgi:hypothetical protein
MTALPFPYHRLPDRSAIALIGEPAPAFLQGLVTADVQDLEAGQNRYGALLTPQGKILFDFFMLRTAEGFLIDCAASQRDELVKRLNFYRLRTKVTVAPLDDFGIGASPHSVAGVDCHADPRISDLGFRIIGPADALPAGDPSEYRRFRFQLGIADTAEIGSGNLFPHEANLDQLAGVSFTKGCYVGQEVVSRMEHRGTARSRVCPVRLTGSGASAGEEIKAGDRTIGTLLAREGEDGLALIRLDRLEEAVAAGDELLTHADRVHVRKPAWAKFAVAGA